MTSDDRSNTPAPRPEDALREAALERLLERFYAAEMPASLRATPCESQSRASVSGPVAAFIDHARPSIRPSGRRASILVGAVAAALLAAWVSLPSLPRRGENAVQPPAPADGSSSAASAGRGRSSHAGGDFRIDSDHAPVELRPDRRTTNVTTTDDGADGRSRLEIEVPELSVEILPLDEPKRKDRESKGKDGRPTESNSPRD